MASCSTPWCSDWIFFGLTVASLFLYRARERVCDAGATRGGFRVPGYPWTPVLFVLAAAYVVASSSPTRATPLSGPASSPWGCRSTWLNSVSARLLTSLPARAISSRAARHLLEICPGG